MKLIITDKEPNTERVFKIDCPFEKEDVSSVDLDGFSYNILRIFKAYGEGGTMSLQYDFELEESDDVEKRLDILSGQYVDDSITDALEGRLF